MIKRGPNKPPYSNERTHQNELFTKRKMINNVNNVYQTSVANIKTQRLKSLEQQSTPSNRMNVFRHQLKNDKFKIIGNGPVLVQHNESDNKRLSRDSITLSSQKDLTNFNSSKRSKVRLLKNIQTDRREATMKVKNKVPNLPQLNNSYPEKLEVSGHSTARSKKSLRKNLVEKLKTFGIHNNATVNSTFLVQAINSRKEKDETNEKFNDTQRTNTNTNPNPSAFEKNTRQGSKVEKPKRMSRKNLIKVQDSLSHSKESNVSRASKISKKFSLSESMTKAKMRGSVTNRTNPIKNNSNVFKSQDVSEERKNSSIVTNEMLLTQAFSPEESNPQQPSCPKKTWPMKPGYCIKTYKEKLTEYEKSEILKYRKIYFVGSKAEKIKAGPLLEHNYGYDDESGNYQVILCDHIAYRYEVVKSLGQGSFGNVLKCWDHKNKAHVALKIIRNEEKLVYQANIEIKILTHLRDNDFDDNYNIARILNSLEFRNHVCIVFELLSINLYDFLKLNDFDGVSMGLIRRFAIQILYCLNYLKSENVVHCDLKPENIVLKNKYKSGLKVIDFGSSTFSDERVYTYIQSRFYRAPEIMFGIPYAYPIDMWSFG